MLLLEIAAQGVKGLAAGAWSVRLARGYNVVAADGAALRTVLDALFDLSPAGVARGVAAGAAAVRAGATALGDDGVTYRVLLELGAAPAWQLQRLDPERLAFLPLTSDPALIEAMLRERIGVPAHERRKLLTLSAGDLPSRAASASAQRRDDAPAGARASTGVPATESRPDVRPVAGASAETRARWRHAEELRQRVVELRERIEERARLRDELARAEEAVSLGGTRITPADLEQARAALDAHATATGRRDRAQAAIEAERAAVSDIAPEPPRPLWARPSFWSGVVAGLGAVAVAAAAPGSGGLRYAALLDVPAFGWSAWVTLRWIGEREAHARVTRRRHRLEEHEREIVEAFERDAAPLRRAMEALGASRAEDVAATLARREEAFATARGARERLEAFESAASLGVDADADLARLESELRAAEDAATDPDAWAPDPSMPEPSRPRDGRGAPGGAASGGLERGAGEGSGWERFLREAAELLVPEAGGERLVERWSELLARLSSGRLARVGAEVGREPVVFAGERAWPVSRLPGADGDLARVALALAAMERGLGSLGPVALVDCCLDGLADAARRAAAAVLRDLALKGQVVHATREPTFRDLAGPVAKA